MLRTVRDGEGLLEYLKRSPVVKDLKGQSLLCRDGGHVGIVLSPYMEGLMKSRKMWNEERTGLLLM